MSDKNSSNKQRTFLFNLSYTGGNNQYKNNYEHLELIYQFYASAISNSNFVIENFKRIPRNSGKYTVDMLRRLWAACNKPKPRQRQKGRR
jgi:hypothetical protein